MRRRPVSIAAAGILCLSSLAAAQEQVAQQRGEREKFIDIPLVESGSRRQQPLPRAPSTISVIQGEDLQSLGLRFLTDGLRRVPGMEVTRISSTESNVSLRGYNDDSSASQGILALVDGRSVYNEFFGSVLWETLPVSLEDVKFIEVVRGPGSFVHGPNAMHGLVNVVTRSPLDYEKDAAHLSASAGSYRSAVATARVVRREGDSGLKATVGWDDIRQFNPRGENSRDKKFVELRYATLLDRDHRVEVIGGGSEQAFDVLIPTFAGIPPVTFANVAQEQFLNGVYTFGALKFQVYWNRFLAESEPDQIYEPFETILNVGDADLQYSLSPLSGHTLTAGTGYRAAAFENEDENVSGGRHRTGLGWIFLQDEFEVTEDLWLTTGLRLDKHTVSGTSESPRLAAVWRFAEDEYVRASAGYGFRNPSLREFWFDMQLFGGPFTIAGNRRLRPEQMRSLEAGYSGRPAKDLRVDLTVYYNLVDRLVEFRPVGPSLFAPKNSNKEDAFGGELEVEYLFADWGSAFVNYAFTVRRDRDTHDRHPGTPRHKANAGVRATLPEGLTAMVWSTYFDDVEFLDTAIANSSIGEVDEYGLLNARVSYRLSALGARGNAFVQAFNLLDKDHREHPQGDKVGLLFMAGVDLTW